MVQYMEPQELAKLLQDKTLRVNRDFAIIDVRDDDFATGNIIGCVNVPCHILLNDLEKYVSKFKHVKKLVFHCALSQVRGPKSANAYYRKTVQLATTMVDDTTPVTTDTSSTQTQEVYVLRGGFTEFARLYSNDAELVENYDEEYWENPW